ncbi:MULTISPECIES: VCBS repeat-containing protein [unclassified Imperialibacter]|uniref:FG-GAP repeat domain-containing protein n=1 Tax=unclassified Imperialibacter TaxID=2629706 RepID=UPI0012550311|nr:MULTISPECIES: VCBS repeat-containing protein [unclassified Imperialibacter]CAD5254969.1 conserved hypothetical protein [Imperialibacter sp. 89]CAD5256330.1 conserved hypothetical protein [Imperialibacter sp. 75]VVT20361.1 conserved hypothetical protein [Imperialibacter sp. EC-SDR9]
MKTKFTFALFLLISFIGCKDDLEDIDSDVYVDSSAFGTLSVPTKADKIYWNYNSSGGQTKVHVATGGGGFDVTSIDTPGSVSSATKWFFADANGDGLADKIYWNPNVNSGQVTVYLSTGTGGFSTTSLYSTGSQSSNTKFNFADVNGDGIADKIYWLYSNNGGRIEVSLGQSSGLFSASVVPSNGSVSTSTTFYFSDVNGDGLADKIYWNPSQSGGQTQVYLATSGGSFSSISVSSPGSVNSDTRWTFADANGDGLADKIYWNPNFNGGQVTVYLATNSGSFSTTPIYSGGSQSNNTSMQFVDVSGDGIVDKIYWLYSNNGGRVEVSLGQSSGVFSSTIIPSSGSQSSNTVFYFADVNGN